MVDEAEVPGQDIDEEPSAEAPSRPVVTPSSALSGRRLTGLTIALLALLSGNVIAYQFFARQGVSTSSAWIGEVILLIAGFATVTLLLFLGSVILRSLDLGTPEQALGMPEGSIRALIAMSLILIFAIVGFVVLRSGTGTTGASTGVSQAQIDQLRSDGVQITNLRLTNPGAAAGQERYDVDTVIPLSQDSHDFGLQLLSTVSTLVVAVAGFYFGARSVSEASKVVQAQQALLTPRESEDGGAGGTGAAPTADTKVIGTQQDPEAAATEPETDPDAKIEDVADVAEKPKPEPKPEPKPPTAGGSKPS